MAKKPNLCQQMASFPQRVKVVADATCGQSRGQQQCCWTPAVMSAAHTQHNHVEGGLNHSTECWYLQSEQPTLPAVFLKNLYAPPHSQMHTAKKITLTTGPFKREIWCNVELSAAWWELASVSNITQAKRSNSGEVTRDLCVYTQFVRKHLPCYLPSKLWCWKKCLMQNGWNGVGPNSIYFLCRPRAVSLS